MFAYINIHFNLIFQKIIKTDKTCFHSLNSQNDNTLLYTYLNNAIILTFQERVITFNNFETEND